MTTADVAVHVLYVDDDPAFADTAAAFLEREDDRLSVRTATAPREGIDILATEDVDCVVSDYDMPGTNGIEFLELVREDHPDLPFVLYTGKGSEAVASDAISAGVTDYLQKETGTSQYTLLANRIQNAVDTYRTRAELAAREKRLNLFFEQSPLGVIEWDERFDLVRMNEAAAGILGYTEDDLRGDSWERIVPESDREAVDDVVSDLLSDEGGYHSVNENVRKDGDRIVCEWHNRVVTDASGDVVAVFSQFQDVTERRRRERETERRRHRLEQILKTVPGCVVQLDAEGRFVFANRRAEEVLGLERDELTDRAYNDPEWAIRDLDGDPIPDADLPFRRVRDTGEPLYGFRHTVRWPDGTEKALLVNGAPLFDDGDVDSVVFSLTDITDQRAQAQELLETRRRLELALEATDTGVWEWNLDTDEVTWNGTLERVMGFEPGSFEGTLEAFVDRVHPEDVDRVRAQLQEAIETDSMYQAEFRMYERDGTVQWVEVRGQLVDDGDGDRMVGVHHDVTERKERERQLATVKRQYQTLVDNFPDGAVFLFDENCEYVRAGGEEIAAVGLSPEAFVGATPHDLFPEDVAAETVDHYRAALDGDSRTYEQEYADNRYRIQTVPVRTGDGDVPYGLAVSNNVTEQVERRRELERQNELLDRFASVVSHDLRNQLNVVEGRLELARQECDSDHLDAAAVALDRSFALIDDVLTLAREGRAVSEAESVDLAVACRDCWRTVETAGATLRTATDREIRADRTRLQQVLANLFRNAVEHSSTGNRAEPGDSVEHGSTGNRAAPDDAAEHGGGTVTVTVGDLTDGFYVEDDGPGIPAEDREDVFDAGYSTAERGTGFGLSIVAEIADAHGWGVRVTEGSAGGARFEITGVEFAEGPTAQE